MAKRFFIYGIIGWGIEILWTGCESLINGDLRLIGYSNLWMFAIYGCAVFLEPLHDIIAAWKWYFRGVIWVILILGMEYTSGLILYTLLGVRPWHYTGPFSVDGFVMLSFAPAWFAAGLLFERLHFKLDAYGAI